MKIYWFVILTFFRIRHNIPIPFRKRCRRRVNWTENIGWQFSSFIPWVFTKGSNVFIIVCLNIYLKCFLNQIHTALHMYQNAVTLEETCSRRSRQRTLRTFLTKYYIILSENGRFVISHSLCIYSILIYMWKW